MKRMQESCLERDKEKSCLLTLNLNPFRLEVNGNGSAGQEFQSLVVRGKKMLTQRSLGFHNNEEVEPFQMNI